MKEAPAHHDRRESWRSILGAVLPFLSFIVQWTFWPIFKPLVWFLFYPAVFISSWIGNFYSGIAATVISIVLAWIFFMPAGGPNVPSTVVFFIMGIVFSKFHERLKRANREAADASIALQRSVDEIEDLYNNAPCGYHSLDKDGFFIKVNDTELSWLGYSREELIGKKRAFELMPPESVEKFKADYPQFIKNGYVKELEFEFIRKDGTTIPVLVSGSAIYDDDGNFLMSRTTLFDVTIHKKREAELKKLELEYRTIVQGAMDGFVMLDTKGCFLDVNDTYSHLIGYSRDELLKMSISDVEAIENPEDTANHIQKVMRAGSDRFETRHRRKDGVLVDIEVSVNYVDIAGGRFYSFYRDITERKKAEEELRRSREQLRTLTHDLQSAREEERKRIARDIHDELGQALTVLNIELSCIEEILDKKPELATDRIRKAMSLVDGAIDSVQRIASDLRPTLLDDLGIAAAIESYANNFKDRTGIEALTVFYPDKINVDRALATELFRVFQETMTNVSRHARATKVEISLRRVEHKLIMQIADIWYWYQREEDQGSRLGWFDRDKGTH